MSRVLNWSASPGQKYVVPNLVYVKTMPPWSIPETIHPSAPRAYIRSVVDFCEKPGNVDRLVKNLGCKVGGTHGLCWLHVPIHRLQYL